MVQFMGSQRPDTAETELELEKNIKIEVPVESQENGMTVIRSRRDLQSRAANQLVTNFLCH